jgi:hypothetical protein
MKSGTKHNHSQRLLFSPSHLPRPLPLSHNHSTFPLVALSHSRSQRPSAISCFLTIDNCMAIRASFHRQASRPNLHTSERAFQLGPCRASACSPESSHLTAVSSRNPRPLPSLFQFCRLHCGDVLIQRLRLNAYHATEVDYFKIAALVSVTNPSLTHAYVSRGLCHVKKRHCASISFSTASQMAVLRSLFW